MAVDPRDPPPEWPSERFDDARVAVFQAPCLVSYLPPGAVLLIASDEIRALQELLGAITPQRAIDDALAFRVAAARAAHEEATGVVDDESPRFPPPEEAWLLLDGQPQTLERIRLDPDVIDELCRRTVDPRRLDAIGWATEIVAALETLAEHVRNLQAAAPVGSIAAAPVVPWRPPVVPDPLPLAEARAAFTALARRIR